MDMKFHQHLLHIYIYIDIQYYVYKCYIDILTNTHSYTLGLHLYLPNLIACFKKVKCPEQHNFLAKVVDRLPGIWALMARSPARPSFEQATSGLGT